MILASEILATVRKTTLDGAARAYANADLLGFLNEAQRSAAGEKPDFYTVTANFTPVAGEDQVLPEDGVSLFDIPSNTVANGGRVVTLVQRELLAEASRFWPRGTRQAEEIGKAVRDTQERSSTTRSTPARRRTSSSSHRPTVRVVCRSSPALCRR